MKAYSGRARGQFPKYWLLFQVSVPQLGWNTYFISKGSGGGKYSSFYPCLSFFLSCDEEQWTSFEFERYDLSTVLRNGS